MLKTMLPLRFARLEFMVFKGQPFLNWLIILQWQRVYIWSHYTLQYIIRALCLVSHSCKRCKMRLSSKLETIHSLAINEGLSFK